MIDDASHEWLRLPPPPNGTLAARRMFLRLARELASAGDPDRCFGIVRSIPATADARTRASISILADLVVQGWQIRVTDGAALVTAPTSEMDATAEKDRVRRQELWKRDEQLRKPSVRRFIREMEAVRLHGEGFVSIFDLMRDGAELADSLRTIALDGPPTPAALRTAVDPYVQVVDSTLRCEQTGLRLLDIWRYFRHTWTNQYNSTPGRTMMILVRDAARPFHPVIGIAALASPIVQMTERDEWIGWQPDLFIQRMREAPTLSDARWLLDRLDIRLSELFMDDLVADGLYWPGLWKHPEASSIQRLRNEAEARRRDHARYVSTRSHKSHSASAEDWVRQATTDLFRSKRAGVLADLLESRAALLPHFADGISKSALRAALDDPRGRQAARRILRSVKSEAVGTEMADLSVCGSIAPYNALLGGKLVSMLAVSPQVIRAYHSKYSTAPSEIASSMAGRPIHRRGNLVFVGTTSLYGSGSSQYNRVRIPSGVLDGSTDDIRFMKLGRSRSYGTSHLSSQSTAALVQATEQSRTGRRVNSIFGEGVNPKLRKVREGIDLLGWPSDALLHHGRERLIYGVPLISNLLPYLSGRDKVAKYVFNVNADDDVERITTYWMARWLAGRTQSQKVLGDVASHTLVRPIAHGARVPVPEATVEEPL
jgi:hypothetical protein